MMQDQSLADFMAAYTTRIGERLGSSDWLPVTQPLIDAFGQLTGDMQPLHVDPEAAAVGPFGGTIAHGFLTLSLLSSMAIQTIPPPPAATAIINYGFDRIRFLSPVRSGARIRGHFALADIRALGSRRWQQAHDVEVEIEGEARPALVARWLSLVT